MHDAEPEGAWVKACAWIGLALVLLSAATLRVRLLDVPLERDEGEYAYIGALLLDGVPPFAAAYTMKLPGTSAMYALAMAAFGRSTAGIRIGLVLTTTTSAVLLFLLGRRLLGSVGGFTTSTAFVGFSLATALLATYAHATHFVVLAAVAGLLALATALERPRLGRLFTSGALFGVAILMKQPGAVFAAFGLYWIAIDWHRTPRRTWRQLGTRVLVFALGVVAPLGATAAVLWHAGTFDTLWLWTVAYAHQYSTDTSLSAGAQRLVRRLGAIVPQVWGLVCLVVAGLALLVFSPRVRAPGRGYFAGLLIFSFAGVCAGMYFRPHYFLLLAPAAALLVGVAAVESRAYAVTPAAKRLVSALAASAAVLALVQSIWVQRDVMLHATPAEVSRAVYLASPFPEAVEVARYLRARTDPRDTIAVLGSEPEIPFYAQRRSATRYLYMYSLMEAHPSARAMQAQFIEEIERARPRYIVYVRSESSWNRGAFSERLVFDWMGDFLPEHYARVGQVDIVGPRDTRYFWDADVAKVDVTPYTHLIVFRRRA